MRTVFARVEPLALSIVISIAAYLSPSAVPAQVSGITACDTLFALRVAEQHGLTDCDVSPVPSGVCSGQTANDCRRALHTDPQALVPPAPTAGELLYSYLPRCQDGTDSCPPNEYIHCIDGTRPMLHADKARDDDGFIESDRWLFYVSGGGSCHGPDCWRSYRSTGSRLEMSTCHPDTVNCSANSRSHVGNRVSGTGILSPNPANPFRAFNRVRIQKCAYDGFQGDASEHRLAIDRDGDGAPEQRIERTFHQGHLVYKAALNFLAGGVTLAGGAGPTLPPLANAELIVLAGNSGGGKAMIMTGDRLRDHLEQEVLDSEAALVRLVIDAHYLPGLENEAAFGTALGPELLDQNDNYTVDVFDHHFTGVRGRLPDDPDATKSEEFYSDWTYVKRQGRARQTAVAYMGTDLSAADASCVATHPGETSFCLDEIHVLLNHVTTPFFIRMDLQDNAWIAGSALFGGRFGPAYDWPDQEFIDRVDLQARNYLDFHRADSELMEDEGGDESGDPTCSSLNDLKPICWPHGMWAPSAGGAESHTGLLDPFHLGIATPSLELSLCEDELQGIVETRHTMASVLLLWLDQDEEIDARPFYDRSTVRARYWVDPAAATCEVELDCGNGLDDEGDGLIDGADTDCQSP